MLQLVTDYYHDMVQNKSDPRVLDLYLMKDPWPTLLISILYLLIVLKIGPRFMKERKPYNLQSIITVYNAFQVYLSAYLVYECLAIGWLTKYSIFQCHSVDYSVNPAAKREMMVLYIYYLSKYTEFFDTFFFVLRKKDNQVSFLHVYHHVIMPTIMWIATKYYPGGSTTFIVFINTFIHVIMYFYYLLAGLGPHMQKYLWWKKYLTGLQLVQFCIGTFHFCLMLYKSGPECRISRSFSLLYIIVGVVFYILFSSFYKKVYKKPIDKEISSNGVKHNDAVESRKNI